MLHIGKINTKIHKSRSLYIISSEQDKEYVLKNLRGRIRVKQTNFIEACNLYNLNYIKPYYRIGKYNSYFGGLIDTKGSIVYNSKTGIIECNIQFLYNEYTAQLNFDDTIPYSKPEIYKRKSSKKAKKDENFKYITFKFEKNEDMPFIYDYFCQVKLYCDMKNYRAMKIKNFINIKDYRKYPFDSPEYKYYHEFLSD
jgi:hypothetical protein